MAISHCEKQKYIIKLIVGLGNPGPEYIDTRHNIGAKLLRELLCQQTVILKNENKFFGLYGRKSLSGESRHFLMPTTFMNNSGNAVVAVAKFYKIPPQSILILHDDLDLPVGTIRLKQGGGHAGHNGLRSIINFLTTPNFLRLRIGINHPGDKRKVTNYVLRKPDSKDTVTIMNSINRAIEVFPTIIDGDVEKAMQILHTE